MTIKKPCKYCQKVSDLTSEIDLGPSGKMLVFACGHSYIEPKLQLKEAFNFQEQSTYVPSLAESLAQAVPEFCETHQRNCIKTLQSRTGKHLFPYQAKGITAATNNNANFIFADEMGLGKTVQGLGTILLNKEKLLPAIFLCKSIAKTNWLWETMDWLQVPAQVIYSSSETPFDMFKVHILSHDMISKLNKKFDFKHLFGETDEETIEETKQDDLGRKVIVQKTVKRGKKSKKYEEDRTAWKNIFERCQLIVLDESHLLKNPESQRSKAVVQLCSLIPHKICMSGTLIKNNAKEYFVPLNIVKPEKFWSFSSFCNNYVRFEMVKTAIGWSHKFTGLIDPSEFKEECKEFMIRRTTDEVMPELPKLFKKPHYVELDEQFKKIYEESEQNFADWFDNASQKELTTNLLAQLAILRHETSLAKVDCTIDLVMDFLLSTEEKKIAIFTHHIDSRNALFDRMNEYFKELNKDLEADAYPMVTMLGRGANVQDEIEEFKNGRSRVLILSTLSHGESINLQFCADSILHERQWNPANEDQAISGRFRRIGQEAKSISCMIPIALGTIDEYFTQLVDGIKTAIGKEWDSGKVEEYNTSLVMDLASKIAEKGRKKWTL